MVVLGRERMKADELDVVEEACSDTMWKLWKRLNLHTWRPAVYILIEGFGTGDGSVEANHQRYYRRVL